MNKKIIFSVMLVCLLTLGLISVSCGNSNSSLAGIWELERVENGSTSSVVQRIEFFKDGIGNMDGVAITWKTENNRMMVTAFGQAQTESYKLSGKTLKFTTDNGKISIYKKVN